MTSRLHGVQVVMEALDKPRNIQSKGSIGDIVTDTGRHAECCQLLGLALSESSSSMLSTAKMLMLQWLVNIVLCNSGAYFMVVPNAFSSFNCCKRKQAMCASFTDQLEFLYGPRTSQQALPALLTLLSCRQGK
jgi:hypothetical protein